MSWRLKIGFAWVAESLAAEDRQVWCWNGSLKEQIEKLELHLLFAIKELPKETGKLTESADAKNAVLNVTIADLRDQLNSKNRSLTSKETAIFLKNREPVI